jgi:hypothetical protein
LFVFTSNNREAFSRTREGMSSAGKIEDPGKAGASDSEIHYRPGAT